MENSFATTVATPAKCSGRAAPSKRRVISATVTVVSTGRGYISSTPGWNTSVTPAASARARSRSRSHG